MVQSDALMNLLLEGYAPLLCILKDVWCLIVLYACLLYIANVAF